jgi:hypothetical protein
MGSKTFDGVWFISFSHDHLPPHVHGRYAGVEVIVDLLPGAKVIQSKRKNAVRPKKSKQSDVRKILRVAAENSIELGKLWESTHGTAS